MQVWSISVKFDSLCNFLCSNDEDRRSENDDRVEYKDEDANVTEVKNIKIHSNNLENKSSAKSNRKIDLGAAANYGKDQNSVVSNLYLVFLYPSQTSSVIINVNET